MSTLTLHGRTAHRFANYNGKLPDDILGTVMGPNLMNELMTVVQVEHTETGTRLGFDWARQEDLVKPDDE